MIYTCIRCEKEFKRNGTRVPKYCSLECKNKDMILSFDLDKAVEMYNQNLSLSEIGYELGVCHSTVGKNLRKAGIKIRSNTAHLSTDKNPTKGKKLDLEARKKISKTTKVAMNKPETRAKLRDIMINRLMSDRDFKHMSSKLEDKVSDVLREMKIKFDRHVAFRNEKGRFIAIVDFQLEDKSILEVNGTFWHADEREYPNGPEYKTQKKAVERYERKKTFLKEMGLHLQEVWEIDFNKNPKESVKKAISHMS